MKIIKNITVILSVFNGGEHLKYAIESILNQSFKNFEFIIIDNASIDETPLILEKYRLKDKRIKIITLSKTLSYVEGRYHGIKKCETEWFALMDADDISMPDRLKREVDFINSTRIKKIGAIGTWGEYINSKGKVLGNIKTGPTTIKEFDYLYKNNEAIVILDPSSLINKKAFIETGGYRKNTFPPCDLDFWYRLSEKGYKILTIPENLIQYRVHLQSNSVRKTMLQRKIIHFVNYNMRLRRKNKMEITKDDFEKFVWSNLLYKLPRKYNDFVMLFFKKAGLNFGNGNYLKTFSYLVLVFLMNPKYIFEKIYLQNYFTNKKVSKLP